MPVTVTREGGGGAEDTKPGGRAVDRSSCTRPKDGSDCRWSSGSSMMKIGKEAEQENRKHLGCLLVLRQNTMFLFRRYLVNVEIDILVDIKL